MDKVQKKPVQIVETVLRDAHQSLFATRMTTEEMLPIIDKMDKIGYRSVECWGGATFDSCLRFLHEDPWDRLRALKKGFKNTKLQMLFRGQNILGYNHYADDVVEYFVEKSVANGIDIIRIFDCLNDLRNLETAVKACKKEGGAYKPQVGASGGNDARIVCEYAQHHLRPAGAEKGEQGADGRGHLQRHGRGGAHGVVFLSSPELAGHYHRAGAQAHANELEEIVYLVPEGGGGDGYLPEGSYHEVVQEVYANRYELLQHHRKQQCEGLFKESPVFDLEKSVHKHNYTQ